MLISGKFQTAHDYAGDAADILDTCNRKLDWYRHTGSRNTAGSTCMSTRCRSTESDIRSCNSVRRSKAELLHNTAAHSFAGKSRAAVFDKP